MAKKDKRFRKIHTENGFGEACMVLQDTETGVNYLFVQSGYAGGLTPLLNRDGSPVVTNAYEEPEE